MNTYRIKSWQWLCALLVLAAGVTTFTACSKDDEGMDIVIDNPAKGTNYDPDKGKNNTTDLVVTGGVSSSAIGEDDAIEIEVSGYLNMPDELKATLGLGVQMFGIEVSTDQSFPENATKRTAGRRLEDNRKFTVAVGSLKESTLYYYRSFFGAGETFVFGAKESFTTPSIAEVLGTLKTENPKYVRDDGANIPVSGEARQIAYDTDASKLTAENIRQEKVKLCNRDPYDVSSCYLNSLESGTTYYYRAVRIVKGYVGLGEVKSFKTSGLNAKELAKSMTFNITYDETKYQWKAIITSSLASQYSGSNIKYAIRAYIESNYPLTSDADEFTVTRYGGDDKKIYAEGSGSSYTAVTYPPMYWGAHYNDRLEDGLEFDSENLQNYVVWKSIRRNIYYGIASEDEKSVYEYFGGDHFYEWAYHKDTYQYIHNYLDVIVEIDGKEYVVKTQEGKLRMIWDIDPTQSSSGRGGQTGDEDKDKDRIAEA